MIVRAGSRLVPDIGPLMPTRSWTIEGPERFGGSRVPTGGAGAWGGGRRPVALRGLRGLSGTPVVTMRNLTTGQAMNTPGSFAYGPGNVLVGPDYPPGSAKVGDRWQMQVSGVAPNNAVQIQTVFNGLALPMSGQQDLPASILLGRYIDGSPSASWGIADANGNFSISGTFGPGQIGAWIVGGNVFTVTDAQGNVTPYTGPTQPGGVPYYTLATNHPPSGGSIPTDQTQTLQQQLGSNVMLPSGQIVTAQQSAALAGSTPKTSGPIAPGSVAFSNLTTGNASVFRVGDSWRVSISGASPNQPVVVTGVQNGKSSTSQLGTTDANGSWSSTGTMDASTVGNWTESWTVGGVPAASLAFTVAAASGASQPAGSAAPTPAGAFDIGSVASVFSGSAIGGIPNWALIAAGLGLVFVLGSKR